MQKKTIATLITGIVLSSYAMAGTMGSIVDKNYSSYSIIGSLGYTWYEHLYRGNDGPAFSEQAAIGDGQTALIRFAIAKELGAVKNVRFGVEVGGQNGNTARLAIPQATLDLIGELHPQVTIKPMLDLLATATWQPVESYPVLAIVKPGIAYRRLQVNDRVTFNDLSEVAFELQAGLGIRISDRSILSLNYQGVFAGKTSYVVNTTTYTGTISNIPMQNGVLLSLSYTV